MRLAVFLTWCLLVAAFVVTGCGGDDDAKDPTPEQTARDESSPSAEEAASPEQTATEGEEAWTSLPPLPSGPRQELGVATLRGEVYTVGGFDTTGNIVGLVEVYDPESETWRTVAPVPAEIHHANVVASDDRLYVIGFQTGPFIGDGRVFEYDPDSDSWTQKAPMPAGTERGASGAALVDGFIYVAGGFREGQAVSDFARYDPASDTWEELPDMPAARDHLAAAGIDGLFFAIGGRLGAINSHSPLVFSFDPATDEWTERAPMPTSRGGIAAAVLEGLIYVFGGEGNAADPTGVFEQVEVYDPATDTWSSAGSMAAPRHGTGAAVIGDFICLPGGADVQAFGAVDTADAFRPPD
ncbi:MAG: kelch repeat-containing protein [Dehalococcoidia bacterium]